MPEYPAGHDTDFAEGQMVIRDIAGHSIGIVRIDGELQALRNLCPHQLAPICRGQVKGTMLPSSPDEIVYGLDRQVIRCPRHGWEFDLRTGKALFGVSPMRLRKYPIRSADGTVLVDVKDPPGRSQP